MSLCFNFDEFNENISVYEILSEFLIDKQKGIKNYQWELIPKVQYHNALKMYMKDGKDFKFPRRILEDWLNLICHNLQILEIFTELAGHSSWFPFDDVNDMLDTNFTDFYEAADYLDEIGIYDWMVLPDGSDAISDYGLEPIYKVLQELPEFPTKEEMIISINRCLDVIHQRGDLSSVFIEGGRKSLNQISNECRLNEMSLYKSHLKDFESFYNFIETSLITNSTLINKVYFKINETDIGIPGSTIRHSIKKHLTSLNDWLSLIKNIKSPELFVESRKSYAFKGINFLLKYSFNKKDYGVGICKTTNHGYLITTFFEGNSNSIENWLLGNGKAQPKMPTAIDMPGFSLSEELYINIINQKYNILNSTNENYLQKYKNEVFAYSGSGVDYDKLSYKAINSGEGYAAHGWGFYYATNKDVADNYRVDSILNLDNIPFVQFNNKKYYNNPDDTKEQIIYNILLKAYGMILSPYHDYVDKNKLKEVYEDMISVNNQLIEQENDFIDTYNKYLEDDPKDIWIIKNIKEKQIYINNLKQQNDLCSFALDFINKNSFNDKTIQISGGQVHEVELPDGPYIEENKSIQNQSREVKNAVYNVFKKLDINETEMNDLLKGDMSTVYYNLCNVVKDKYGYGYKVKEGNGKRADKIVSRLLNNEGIKGIHYFGDRDGECYVIFNLLDVKVKDKKYENMNERLEKVELLYGNQMIDTVVSFSPSNSELEGLLNKYKALRVLLAKEPGKSDYELVCIPAAVGDHGLLAKWLIMQGYELSFDTFYHIVKETLEPYLTLDGFYIDDVEELKQQLLIELSRVTEYYSDSELKTLIKSVNMLIDKLPSNVNADAVQYAIDNLT